MYWADALTFCSLGPFLKIYYQALYNRHLPFFFSVLTGSAGGQRECRGPGVWFGSGMPPIRWMNEASAYIFCSTPFYAIPPWASLQLVGTGIREINVKDSCLQEVYILGLLLNLTQNIVRSINL